MRLLADYLIPLLLVGLGYVGIQKLVTSTNLSFIAKFILRTGAVALLVSLLLYEYFTTRPIVDSLREATGDLLCRHFVVESCPDSIKIDVLDHEAGEYFRRAAQLQKQNKRIESQEALTRAQNAQKRAWDLREQSRDKQKLALAINAMKVHLGAGVIIGKSAVFGEYALVSWVQHPTGGEAILKYDATRRDWTLIELGGGAWDIDGLAKFLNIPREKAKGLLDKVPITGMVR